LQNTIIREKIRTAGVFQYEVADQLGVSEMSFIRWLRKPLSAEKEEKVIRAISMAKAQKGGVSLKKVTDVPP